MKQIMLIISLFFCANNKTRQDFISKRSIEKTFEIWNQKTISSIRNQLSKTSDQQIRSILQNHLDVNKLSLYSLTDNEQGLVDKGKPSRIKFLQAIAVNKKIGNNFFIIESIKEGEVIQYINYLIENDTNTSHVIVYHYLRNNWRKVRDTMISKANLHSKLNVNSGISKLSGINESSVILSEFDLFIFIG